MKTRAELYGHEATELLRIISMYPGLSEKQLCRFYPGREAVTRNLLSHLCRQGRTRQADTGGYFPYGNGKAETDPGMVRAAWVLLDFIDRAEYHSSSEFPCLPLLPSPSVCTQQSARHTGSTAFLSVSDFWRCCSFSSCGSGTATPRNMTGTGTSPIPPKALTARPAG